MASEHQKSASTDDAITPEGRRSFDASMYDGYSRWKGWDQHFSCSDLDRERFRIDFAGIDLSGKRLLEIGFGAGALLVWARERGAEVSGSEINEDSIAAAKTVGVPLIGAAFEQTGELGEAAWDIIVAYDVFEHLDPPMLKAKLVAIGRALRPGGLLVLRYPNGQSPFGLPSQHGDATHIQALSEMKMRQFAEGTPLVTKSYRGAAFAAHPRLTHRVVTWFRHGIRSAMMRMIQFAIATDIPLDPVMLHVMRKS